MTGVGAHLRKLDRGTIAWAQFCAAARVGVLPSSL